MSSIGRKLRLQLHNNKNAIICLIILFLIYLLLKSSKGNSSILPYSLVANEKYTGNEIISESEMESVEYSQFLEKYYNFSVFTTAFEEEPNKETNNEAVVPENLTKEEILANLRAEGVVKQRINIKKEMVGYDYTTLGENVTLDKLLMEQGGRPIINIICTTWRSGSTFLGEAVASHPATYYYYEPLAHFGIKQVRSRSGELAKEGFRVLKNQMNCNFTTLEKYMTYGVKQRWIYYLNQRVWQNCQQDWKTCDDAKFMSDMCRLFPFQLFKTVKFRLNLAKELLENKDFDIRLLLLVRDPRGTMQSRYHRSWCPEGPDCSDPARLCMDLSSDFNEAKLLREKYPDRFLSVRYEDVSQDPHEALRKILKLFRLQYHPKVKEFLDTHTTENRGGVGSTFRDSKSAPFHWREDFVGNFSKVRDIQDKCGDAMKVWGYIPAAETDDLRTFNPLKEPPFKEMVISDK